MLAVAVPVAIFLALLHALYYFLVRRFRSTDAWLLIASTGIAMIAVTATLSDVSPAVSLVLLMCAPAATIVTYEARGYRHQVTALSDAGT